MQKQESLLSIYTTIYLHWRDWRELFYAARTFLFEDAKKRTFISLEKSDHVIQIHQQ